MRILFVAKTDNPHTARWISQLADTGWDIHILGDHSAIHPLLRNVTVHKPFPNLTSVPSGVKVHYVWPLSRGEHFLRHRLPLVGRLLLPNASQRLVRLVRKLQPDCVHSLKMRPYAYYVMDAKGMLAGQMPPWICSAWGSDLSLYRQYDEELPKIKRALATCDYFLAGCSRDVETARELGLRGDPLGVIPSPGGFDVVSMQAQQSATLPSKRWVIAVKGYQTDLGGQALTALDAFGQLGDVVAGYTIVVHSAIGTYASKQYDEVRHRADEISAMTGVSFEFLPLVPPKEIWRLFGRARISIGISKIDGTPNTMLESMIMGAFPIQSDTAAISDWIQHGVNGSVVPHNDTSQIADAIRLAVLDDNLVDNAAALNREITMQRLDIKVIKPRVIDLYQYISE